MVCMHRAVLKANRFSTSYFVRLMTNDKSLSHGFIYFIQHIYTCTQTRWILLYNVMYARLCKPCVVVVMTSLWWIMSNKAVFCFRCIDIRTFSVQCIRHGPQRLCQFWGTNSNARCLKMVTSILQCFVEFNF